MANPFKKIINFFDKKKDKTRSAKSGTVRSAKSAGKSAASSSSSSSNTEVSGIFQRWAYLYSDSGSSQQNAQVLLLQKQIEMYEKEIEKRRERLLQEMKPTVFAVTGAKKAKPSLADTDDALPYQPIILDINKVLANIKAKRAAALAAKSGQPIPETKETSTKTSTPAPPKKKVTKSIQSGKPARTPSPAQTTISTSTATQGLTSQSTTAPSVSTAKEQSPPSTSAATPKEEPPSSSSSSSDTSDSERGRAFAGILTAMIEEAEKPPEPKPKELEKKTLSGIELARMSRNEPHLFELLVTDHTKQSLFVTQPTVEETRNWERKNGRTSRQKYSDFEYLPKQPFESRSFCTSCKPRYPVPSS